MNTFIQKANTFGQQGTPFLFLIDFEQQKPCIFSFDQAAEQGIFIDFLPQDQKNYAWSLPSSPFYLDKQPLAYEDYRNAFNLVQQELQLGNSYLLNLTFPTEIQTNYSLKALFQFSRAPYKLLWDQKFVCFSPESFVQMYDDKIFTYPMKGTIDATLPNAEQILLNSQKEQWEHYTIVDLMRNDLAMVAKNIQVTRFRYIDRIQTEKGEILQTSSEICGELDPHWQSSIGSILAKLLPAGSISGAPKQKTVQIISQAEQQRRGYYTGIFGFFDGNALYSAVAIRFIEQRGDKLLFRSGGGITTQSQCEDEYQELIQKVYVPII